MVMNDSSSDGPEGEAFKKKPYQRPSFQYEEVFVTSALTCSKQPVSAICLLHLPASSS